MFSIGFFIAGFTGGWMSRSAAVGSARGAAVSSIATFFHGVDRVRRAVAMEREHLEDLLAEARVESRSRHDPDPGAVAHVANDRAA